MRFTIPELKARTVVPAIVIIAVLALFPVIGVPRIWLLYLFFFFVYLSMANMWNLLAGYSGLICLCMAELEKTVVAALSLNQPQSCCWVSVC